MAGENQFKAPLTIEQKRALLNEKFAPGSSQLLAHLAMLEVEERPDLLKGGSPTVGVYQVSANEFHAAVMLYVHAGRTTAVEALQALLDTLQKQP